MINRRKILCVENLQKCSVIYTECFKKQLRLVDDPCKKGTVSNGLNEKSLVQISRSDNCSVRSPVAYNSS